MIMNTTIQNTVRAASFFLCGALALSALQAAARAADSDVPSQRVSYADLDISKPAGAKVLYGRIVSAAHRVCGSGGFEGLSRKRQIDMCTDKAIDNAVKEVDSPALSALRPSSAIHVASN
jgi:UrcA family protein